MSGGILPALEAHELEYLREAGRALSKSDHLVLFAILQEEDSRLL